MNNENQKPIIIVQQEKKESNPIGIVGFVLAIISLFIGWLPVFGWLFWLLALILSVVGIFKKPRGLAIAGLIISIIGILFAIFIFGLWVIGSTA